ncbi:NmrA family NAD(P)-binding protein [Nocardioides sp. NPDC047086]|uniref:NmrA family NAD(P)-binding protein n=1 Tax=Nocardioides sp. NPDC047086 TaxID=3154810 RepID=UPI0033E07D2B
MTSRPIVAVTGATGFVGGAVARAMGGSDAAFRLLVRDTARAPEIPGVDAFAVTYGDREAAVRALDGVQTVLMVSASESADRLEQHLTFVDAAAAAGVEHVVYTSFFGAAPDAVFTLARDHFATEERIKASGMGYTLLRDNFYLDFLPSLVGEDGAAASPRAHLRPHRPGGVRRCLDPRPERRDSRLIRLRVSWSPSRASFWPHAWHGLRGPTGNAPQGVPRRTTPRRRSMQSGSPSSESGQGAS